MVMLFIFLQSYSKISENIMNYRNLTSRNDFFEMKKQLFKLF